MTVAKLEATHTKAVKATVAAWRVSVGKPKTFPNHTRGHIGLIERVGDAPVRYTSIDPDLFAAEYSITHETIDPDAPVSVVEPEAESAPAGDFLASLLARFVAA
jgi:hypothetical protein